MRVNDMEKRFFLTLLLMIGGLTACTLNSPSVSQKAESTMQVYTDVNRLSSRIRLPEGVTGATWTVVPVGKGNSSIPGPTDVRLYGFLSLDKEKQETLKASIGKTQDVTVNLPSEIANAILEKDLLTKLKQEKEGFQVTGKAYEVNYFNRGSYRGVYAVEVGTNILVCLQTS